MIKKYMKNIDKYIIIWYIIYIDKYIIYKNKSIKNIYKITKK